LKSQLKATAQLPVLSERTTQVLGHFRSHPATRPRSQKKLVSFLIANQGHKISEADALSIIKNLVEARHISIGEKGAVTYYLEPK